MTPETEMAVSLELLNEVLRLGKDHELAPSAMVEILRNLLATFIFNLVPEHSRAEAIEILSRDMKSSMLAVTLSMSEPQGNG
jgi:hypothetical protein